MVPELKQPMVEQQLKVALFMKLNMIFMLNAQKEMIISNFLTKDLKNFKLEAKDLLKLENSLEDLV